MDHIENYPDILLIGGTGRSGTNITKRILSNHSKVLTLPFEHRFTIDPRGIVPAYNTLKNTWTPFAADETICSLEKYLLSLSKQSPVKRVFGNILKMIDPGGLLISNYSYFGWELNKWFPGYEYHVINFISDLESFRYRGRWPGTSSLSYKNHITFSEINTEAELQEVFRRFLNRLISDLLKKNSKNYFAEDNTWNILHANTLLQLFPKAKLIHIKRNYKDVIASMIEQRWCPSNLQQATSFYKAIMQRWLTIKDLLPAGRYIEVQFEDLILDPQKIIHEILNFSDLQEESSVYNIDLTNANINRWEKDFSPEEKKFLDLIEVKEPHIFN